MFRLAEPPPDAPRELLDRRVIVTEILDHWAYLAGWGDGPYAAHPGALLRLAYRQGNQVFFSGGAEGASGTILGHFHVQDLCKVQDFNDPDGPKQ